MSIVQVAHTTACIIVLLWLTMAGVAPASTTFKSLASFDRTNGYEPNHTALTQATDGNLYGTTSYGGGNGQGAVFRVTPSGTLTAIHSFCSLAKCADGANPYTSLIQASNGDLYGATYYGGASNGGTLFKITSSGTLTTLYSFCSKKSCADGAGPEGQLAEDSAGNIYGTANYGGASNLGTVFKFSTTGVLTTLHSFSGADGEYPEGGLVAASGVFYGTAEYGGAKGDGTVFKITTAGAETTLHSFTGSDGYSPRGWLVDVAGTTLYGTTAGGAKGEGTVFAMTSAGKVTTLYTFCSLASCADGAVVTAGLMQATDGNLYGVTDAGGAHGDGTAYELTLKGVLTTLHSFDGTDGDGPQGGLVQDTNGDFYGITEFGGSSNDGTVFSIATGLKPFVTLESASGTVGSKVGILGDGFDSASEVKFNGVKAASTLTEAGLLTATVPAGATDGKVTVTTGTTTLSSTQNFIVHNTWIKGKAMPTGTVFSSAAVLNGEVYVIGGDNASGTVLSDVQIYNPSTNAWSTGTPLPTATDSTSAAVVNNILYVFGGSPSSGGATNAVWAYDPSTKKWSGKAAMLTARNETIAVVEKNIVYVIGGSTGHGDFVATVESYNPATNTWKSETSMAGNKDAPGGGVIGTTVLAVDGSPAPSEVTGDTEGYNASTNKWTELTADPTARTGPCSGVVNGILYDISGYINNAGAATTVNESFNLSTNKWTTTLAKIPQGTMFPATVVANGQLYCFGGWAVVNSTAINNVQIYQP
jgi:uncharacterized repeat protein (TIGR03803 family)